MLLAGGMTSNYMELVSVNHSQALKPDDVDYDYYREPSSDSIQMMMVMFKPKNRHF
jgi:hypothetical protein